MRFFGYLSSSVIALAAAAPAMAQDGFPVEDQISVIGSVLERTPANQSLDVIEADEIEALAPASLADVLVLSPAANITTNSRGETLVYLRNAGERQTALYFDGAALNVPWDNRLNLATIPAGAIGSVGVQSGPASSLYGVNAAGGVIEIDPAREPGGLLALSAGEAGYLNGQARWAGESDSAQWLVAAEHLQRDDWPGLVNTDRDRSSLVLRYRQDAGDTAYWSAAALLVRADFGIAPAQFERASQGRQRFWRYPVSDQSVFIARGGLALSETADVHATAWVQRFEQTIESYSDISYSHLDETQIDEDTAWGVRILADQRGLAGGGLRASLTWLTSEHRQTEFAAGALPGPAEAFGDRRISLGLEYERDLSASITGFVGASADRLEVNETAGRPRGDDFATWNATAGLLWHVSDTISLRPSVSRKARIPTLRELYGTALNRFLPNPDLEAETLTSADIEIRFDNGRIEWTATPFYWQLDDTLDQVNLTLGGQRLRQRVNGASAQAAGLETRVRLPVSNQLTIEAGLMAMHLRREEDFGLTGQRFLAERPELLANLAADFAATPDLHLRAEIAHRGRAWSFTDEDVFEALPVSTALNLSARFAPQDTDWEIFVRVDNATDTEIVPQLGLPAPGRQARAGLRLTFGGQNRGGG